MGQWVDGIHANSFIDHKAVSEEFHHFFRFIDITSVFGFRYYQSSCNMIWYTAYV